MGTSYALLSVAFRWGVEILAARLVIRTGTAATIIPKRAQPQLSHASDRFAFPNPYAQQ